MRDRHARHRRPDSDARHRPTDGFRARSATRFARMVRDAVGSLPPPLLGYLDGVHVTVDDLPPVGPADTGHDAIRLGAYVVGPDDRRAPDGQPSPDQVILYRRPLEARAQSQHDLVEVIRETIVHALADHHGLGDDQLGELGWR